MGQQLLGGLRVLELARVLAGPWIGQTLADLGADVVKVESPSGDETRGWGPPFADDGAAAYFHACNRGKRSLTLDFADPDDRALARQLASQADVVVENFKLGGLVKHGLDYASVAATNPGVVYASITGFGQDGPLAPRAGYDFIIQAMGGIMDLTGEPDGEPQKPGVAHADLFTGLYGTIGVLAALQARAQTGKGQWIDLALFDTQLAALANQATNHLIGGVVPRRMGNAHPNIVPYQVFEASDGPLVIACGNDGQFARLCEELGLTLHRDPRLMRNRDRLQHRDEVAGAISARTAGMTRAAVLVAMERAGVPAGPINTVAEAFAEPQAVARGMVETAGASRSPRLPLRFSDANTLPSGPPPRLGEHDAAIRAALASGDGWPERH
ncbi:crotonobetainyl-CoA:carnitine CoA-transferase CaiB-like acyl-CoA transferase [Amaricoccus macauensis]|uniref:Crotonobetainyl-CoA:carnitine CoA-transferase CaiB-like acyl-CoA transferase n=1 Tax=Amaricoccus macauensis TaxID=57001 RepID=A0A840SP95_9RHOB|nr:CaiB/BaiF CoA-transferase family protein [Amaricoccus macauensis]MBB5221122.1 crotonobetainyl-CoA:carnitine CoA-transferase CaiB-like acyl-CoA transferase [Amaricoccus macauensis]